MTRKELYSPEVRQKDFTGLFDALPFHLTELEHYFGRSPLIIDRSIPFPSPEEIQSAVHHKLYEKEHIYHRSIDQIITKPGFVMGYSDLETIFPHEIKLLGFPVEKPEVYVPDDAYKAQTLGDAMHTLNRSIVILNQWALGRKIEDILPTSEQKDLYPYMELFGVDETTLQGGINLTHLLDGTPDQKFDVYVSAWKKIHQSDAFIPALTIPMQKHAGYRFRDESIKYWQSDEVYKKGMKYIESYVSIPTTSYDFTNCEVAVLAHFVDLNFHIYLVFDEISYNDPELYPDQQVLFTDLKTGKEQFYTETDAATFLFQADLMATVANYVAGQILLTPQTVAPDNRNSELKRIPLQRRTPVHLKPEPYHVFIRTFSPEYHNLAQLIYKSAGRKNWTETATILMNNDSYHDFHDYSYTFAQACHLDKNDIKKVQRQLRLNKKAA